MDRGSIWLGAFVAGYGRGIDPQSLTLSPQSPPLGRSLTNLPHSGLLRTTLARPLRGIRMILINGRVVAPVICRTIGATCLACAYRGYAPEPAGTQSPSGSKARRAGARQYSVPCGHSQVPPITPTGRAIDHTAASSLPVLFFFFFYISHFFHSASSTRATTRRLWKYKFKAAANTSVGFNLPKSQPILVYTGALIPLIC